MDRLLEQQRACTLRPNLPIETRADSSEQRANLKLSATGHRPAPVVPKKLDCQPTLANVLTV